MSEVVVRQGRKKKGYGFGHSLKEEERRKEKKIRKEGKDVQWLAVVDTMVKGGVRCGVGENEREEVARWLSHWRRTTIRAAMEKMEERSSDKVEVQWR